MIAVSTVATFATTRAREEASLGEPLPAPNFDFDFELDREIERERLRASLEYRSSRSAT